MGDNHESELQTFVDKHVALLSQEWEEECKEKCIIYDGLTFKELIAEGVVLPKLLIESSATRNGHCEVTFSICSGRQVDQLRIRCGDVVTLHETRYHDTVLAKGVVESTSADTICISFVENLRLSEEKKYGVRSDIKSEITYKRMKRTLHNMLVAPQGPLTVIRDVIFGRNGLQNCPLSPKVMNPDGSLKFINEGLHTVQKEAVEFALKQAHLAIIHGPPGTGKTTTLIEIIQQLTVTGNKVLVCAPSNIAVDCLVEKLLNTQTKHLRLGHPARMLEAIKNSSLDATLASGSIAQIQHDIRKDILNCKRRMNTACNYDEKHALAMELRHLKQEYNTRQADAQKQALHEADAILSTLTSAGSDGPMSSLPNGYYDVVIIDECSQAMEAACWIALPWARKAIIAGDYMQLPPTVRCRAAVKGGLGYSLMERAINKFGEKSYCLLTHQFRMHENIMNWVSHEMYAGKLTADHSVEKHLLKDLPGVQDTDETGTSLLFIDTVGCDMEEEGLDGLAESRCNTGEASVIAVLVNKIVEAGVNAASIAVITPYSLQVRCIRSVLTHHSEVEVRTVDGFQGREKECVLLSLVRSNNQRDLGFLVDHRRLNVAVSRARRFLGVVGDSSTVCHDNLIASLLEHIENHGIVHSAHFFLQGCKFEDEMKKFVVKLKQPLKKQKNVVKEERGTSVIKTSKQKNLSSYEVESMACTQKLNTVNNVDYWISKLQEIMDSNGDINHIFPTSLTSFERLHIHNAAEMLNLEHQSFGEGINRYVSVWKSSVAKLEKIPCGETKLASEVKTQPTSKNSDNDQKISSFSKKALLEEKPLVSKLKYAALGETTLQSQKSPNPQESPRNSQVHHQNSKTLRKKPEPEDFDSVLESFEKLNNTCNHTGCKKSTKLMGQKCDHCKQMYCLKHVLPEIHGCAEAACRAARHEFLNPKPVCDPDKKKIMSKKLKKTISHMSDTRKPQKRGK